MENLENRIKEAGSKNSSLYDFTRKSMVGAAYRVGASFTMDAIYLTAAGAIGYYLSEKAGVNESIARSAYDFVQNLDPAKLGRVATFVVGINFIDYKFDITNRLDKVTKKIQDKVKGKFCTIKE